MYELRKKYKDASAKFVKEKEESLNSNLLYSSEDESEEKEERRARRVVVRCRNTSQNNLSEDTPRLIMETRKVKIWNGHRSFKL